MKEVTVKCSMPNNIQDEAKRIVFQLNSMRVREGILLAIWAHVFSTVVGKLGN